MLRLLSLVVGTGLLLGLGGADAPAQFGIQFGTGGHQGHHGHHNNHNSHGFHGDWWDSDHRHGSGLGFVVGPSDDFHGGFYIQNGRYYYRPYGRGRVVQPIVIQPGSFSHVDDLAQRLEHEMNLLCLDMHDNYNHNRGFRETYREAYRMLELAQGIHASEHQHDRAAIAAMVGELDSLFHHVEGDVQSWSRRARRQWGQGSLRSKMQSVEALIHHLQNDVGVQAPAPGGAPTGPIAPPPAAAVGH
jgi:hypothetical protein